MHRVPHVSGCKHHIFNGAHQTTQRLSPTPLTRIFIWITCRCSPTLCPFMASYFGMYVLVIPAIPLAEGLNAHLCGPVGTTGLQETYRYLAVFARGSSVQTRIFHCTSLVTNSTHTHTHLTQTPRNAGLYVNCVTSVDTHLKRLHERQT